LLQRTIAALCIATAFPAAAQDLATTLREGGRRRARARRPHALEPGLADQAGRVERARPRGK